MLEGSTMSQINESIFFKSPPVCSENTDKWDGPFVDFLNAASENERLLEILDPLDVKQIFSKYGLNPPQNFLFNVAISRYYKLQEQVDYYRCKFGPSAKSLKHISVLYSEFYNKELPDEIVDQEAYQFANGDIVYVCNYYGGHMWPMWEKGLCHYSAAENNASILIEDEDFDQILYSPNQDAITACTAEGYLFFIKNKMVSEPSVTEQFEVGPANQ